MEGRNERNFGEDVVVGSDWDWFWDSQAFYGFWCKDGADGIEIMGLTPFCSVLRRVTAVVVF